MLIQTKRLMKRLNKLKVREWRILSLLMLGAFFQGLFFVYLQIPTVEIFLQKKGLFDIGFDFLLVGIILSFVGRITVKLDRRFGYGGVPLCGALFCVLVGLLWATKSSDGNVWLVNALFIYLYTAPILIQKSFFMIARRFIPLRLDSYKFLGVLGCLFLGLIYGAGQISSIQGRHQTLFLMALMSLGALFVLMKILVLMLPVPSESFVKKSGGVQDPAELNLVACLLILSFLFMFCFGGLDYLFYRGLTLSKMRTTLTQIWFYRGILGLGCLALLYRFNYIYNMISGVALLGALFVISGLSFYGDWSAGVRLGVVGVWVLGYLYWGMFLQTLPRLLVLGQGVRIRWHRDVVCVPLAWLFLGSIILNFSPTQGALMLAVGGCLFLLFLFLALVFYDRFFIKMCQMRRWCAGALMALSQKTKQMLRQGVRSKDLDEVLYFFRLMIQTGFPGLRKELAHGLMHPNIQVRLFCVDRLDLYGLTPTTYRQLNYAFHHDQEEKVKTRILAALIHREGEENPTKVFHKFGAYLDDKKLKSGAILGFLKTGGECALLAMDGLQHLAQSTRKEDIFQALDIIDQVPQTGLIRLVLPLLKHADKEVVCRALLTAGVIGHTQSLSFVLSALDEVDLQESALLALKNYGKLALPPIEKMIGNVHVPLARRKKLVLFLAQLSSGEGKQILLRSLNVADQKLRKDILKALWDSKIVWVRNQRQKILLPTLKRDIQRWYWLWENVQKCGQSPDPVLADSFGFLIRSFKDSLNDLRLILLYQLLLLYPNDLVLYAIQMILKKQISAQMNGVELLQDLIPHKLYVSLRPILMAPIEEQEKNGTISLGKTQAYHFLKKLILNPDFELDRWAVAAALYGLKHVGSFDDLAVLKKAFASSFPVVWEAGLDALRYWGDKPRQKAFLKTFVEENPHLSFTHFLKHQEDI